MKIKRVISLLSKLVSLRAKRSNLIAERLLCPLRCAQSPRNDTLLVFQKSSFGNNNCRNLIPKFWFIVLFLLVMGKGFIALAQEPIPASTKSEILRYREQQDIFSEDLHGLGYIEAAQFLNDETASEKKLLYYYKQGKDYFNNRQYEKALVEFKGALDWNPQYKPALRYVELVEEKIRQKQLLKEKQDLAERKVKQEAQRRQDKEDARLSQKEKLKHEQNINFKQEQNRNFKKIIEAKEKQDLAERKVKQEAQRRQDKEDARLSQKEKIKYEEDIKQEQERYRNLRKINEARIKDLLDARIKQYKSDKKIQEALAREQEKIKAKNAKLENLARLKAEKEQSEKFRRAKLAKEENIQHRSVEEKKRMEKRRKKEELAARIAVEDVLISEREKTKHEQIIKLEQEKSKNLKNLNEARFRDELKEKFKQENLIKHSSVELAQAVKGDSLPDASGVKYKEYITDNFVPDNLELSKIQQEFENKYSEALSEKERIKKDYNKLLEQVNSLLSDNNRVKALESSLERNNSELQLFKRENENIKKDYNKLLSQVKELLVYRERLKNLNDLLEKVMLDKNLFEKEKEIVKFENVELKKKSESLQAALDKITKDAQRYKGAYEKLYSEAVANELKIKEFTNGTPVLEKKNKGMEAELKQLCDENKKIKKDYEVALAQLKESMLNSRRVKELESILIKGKADVNFLMKERDTLKSGRSRVLSQMKGFLEDRRRVKKLESLLEESKSDIKAMQKENDIIRKDYNSLLMQVKASIIDKKRLKDVQEALEKSKADTNLMAKDNEAVKARNAKLNDKIKQFEEEKIKLVKERDTYKTADSAVKELKGGVSNLEKEKSGLLAQLKQAQRENETVKKNYEGLLEQVNDLLIDKNKLKELGDIIEKNKTDKSLLEKDNEAVKLENLGLKNRVKELESLQAQLVKARDEYKTAYENERDDSAKKELKDGIAKLEKEKNDILSELKQIKNGDEDVKKENLRLRSKIEEFESRAAKSQEEYKAAYKKEESSDTLMKELKQIQKENELIKQDYSSLLAQMKDLLADSRRVKEMEAVLQQDKIRMQALEKEKESVKAENIALKDKAKKIEELERKSAKDRGYDGESSAKKLKIKEFRPEDIKMEKSALRQEQSNDTQLKELQSKFEAEKKQLSRQTDEYKKKYLNELEKNNLALQGANNLPQKFGEAVKKNEELLKETSGMHYNLGVFFLKNKEYDRAIVEFEKAIELYPEDPYSYYNLGYIYAQYLIDRGKAVKYFQQFLQLVKSDDKDVEWVKDYLLTWEAYK